MSSDPAAPGIEPGSWMVISAFPCRIVNTPDLSTIADQHTGILLSGEEKITAHEDEIRSTELVNSKNRLAKADNFRSHLDRTKGIRTAEARATSESR
ncbi:hypothetical protein AB0L62_20140 [Nocardia asteroides]|uniref:hypothetical protein n=1 Tax=Nocardia asteroides TaxID=1824 RepID=UPI0034191C28